MSHVTVILPCYNIVQYIDRCLYSVINQTYTDFQLVIVDDGSKDGTWEKCMNWKMRDRRITLVNKQNEGNGFARNMGVRIANSEYITFIDGDDWWHSDYLQEMVQGTEHGYNDIVLCDFTFVYDYGDGNRQQRVSALRFPPGRLDLSNETHLLSRSRAYVWGKLYRRKLFADYHVEQPNHTYEDVSTVPFLMALAKSVYHVPKPLYFYLRNRQTSLMNIFNSLNGLPVALNELVIRFRNVDLFERFYPQLRRLFWGDLCFIHRILNTQFNGEDRDKITELKYKTLYVVCHEFPELSDITNCRYYVCDERLLLSAVKQLTLEAEQMSCESSALPTADFIVVTDDTHLPVNVYGKTIKINLDERVVDDMERLTWDLTDEIFDRIWT